MAYDKFPPADFKRTMDYKQSNIEKAQRSTQESIRVSGSATDATLIVAALIGSRSYEAFSEEDLMTKWEMWREYFFLQRDIDETYKSLTDPLK